MNDADHASGFLLDGGDLSIARIHPAAGECLLLPGLPTGLKRADSGVGMAIIDSGVMSSHPQLRGLIQDQKDFTGTDPEDQVGHGTVVALILMGSSYQAGRESVPGFISAKVVQADGRIDRRHVIEAIHWTAGEKQARVVNLSLGFGGTAEENAGLRAALEAHPQTSFVVAAGNFGPDTKVYPAAFDLPNVISVGATAKDGTAADYSGRGSIYAPGDVALYRPGAEPPGT